jgi:hypothetical protein
VNSELNGHGSFHGPKSKTRKTRKKQVWNTAYVIVTVVQNLFEFRVTVCKSVAGIQIIIVERALLLYTTPTVPGKVIIGR